MPRIGTSVRAISDARIPGTVPDHPRLRKPRRREERNSGEHDDVVTSKKLMRSDSEERRKDCGSAAEKM
jgi:hypothetical protein